MQHYNHTDTFYIVDFDRTLADFDKLFEVFVQVAQQYIDIPAEQIDRANLDVHNKGDSFDTAGYVRDHLRAAGLADEWDKLTHQFIHESHDLDMLLPGAAELLNYFETTGKRYGILTYGNPLWQRLKLSAAGFHNTPRIVTTSKFKGELVSSWKLEDGMFELPAEFGDGTAEKIVLIDDKAVSFEGFPGLPSYGFHVVDTEKALPSQQGAIPINISHCRDLYGVLDRLQRP